MTTARQIYEKAIALIDEINAETGQVNPDTTTDYLARTPYLINILQMELLPYSKTFSKFEISNTPLDNMLSDTGYGTYEHTDEDYEFEATSGGCKAYYFETDGEGTVYIEDYTTTWNTLATISATDSDGFTSYRGLVTPTSGASKTRIRFSGDYFYRMQNIALFDYAFSSALKVPMYSYWVKADLPSDLSYIEDVIAQGNLIYGKDPVWQIEEIGNTKELYYRYDFEGVLKVIYKAIPALIDDIDDTLDIDDYTANIMAYGLAESFVNVEMNDFLQKIFSNKYEEQKATAMARKPKGLENIVDFYGGF